MKCCIKDEMLLNAAFHLKTIFKRIVDVQVHLKDHKTQYAKVSFLMVLTIDSRYTESDFLLEADP